MAKPLNYPKTMKVFPSKATGEYLSLYKCIVLLLLLLLLLLLSLPSDIYRFCQLSKRNTLKKSLNDEIKELYKLTVQKHHSEERLLGIETTQKPGDRLNKEVIEDIVKDFSDLEKQNVIINNLQKLCDVTTIICSQKLCERLSKHIFIFAKKALVFSLPNNSNLKRWGKSSSDRCTLCQQNQTQLHVLNNCPVSANTGRCHWRHNSVLNTQYHYVSQVNGFDIFVDLSGYSN